ncbi:NFACT family protein [Helicobacter cetorum]|uniref:Fibronectin/fibrinogen-binding protein n=1 Tax=Helicobacter cetorum (strain ATCC BAA-540 / CCUG 52418 / MIT 99-5656) TaxID=1163745 RepID=I0ESM9_HELCM|nr:NFACT family protein [Helicobacter cetorum]AFI05948.1 fibronectin/fibrinogen-binding protein [Helicobacter cetorum MIT 99-5656]
MKFFLLKKFSEFLNTQTSFNLKRLNQAQFLLETFCQDAKKYAFVLDFNVPYIGLSQKPLESVLKNTLALDSCLNKFTKNAKILQANMIDNDRILEIKGFKNLAYKSENFILRLELIPKKANLIILDKEKCVIEALRFNDRVAKNDILGTLPPNTYAHKEECLDFKGLLEILEKDFLFYQHKELERKKNQIIKRLNTQKERLSEKLEKLEKPKKLQLEAKELQTQASLLLTYQHLINKHQNSVTLKDFENKECVIEIDNSMPLNAFINKKFTLSKKKKQKSQFLYLEEENLKEKIAFKEHQINYVKEASEGSVLDMFMPVKNPKIKRPMSGYEVLYYKDFKIGLGKNQKENVKLLQDARANDLWMHIRDIPSSHLIVFCQKNTPKDEIILELAKMLIKMQKDVFSSYEIDYTQRKFVKMIKGANVIYSKYRTITLKDT